MFLVKHMPRVVAYLNYRIVDVSSIKELARRWFPKVGLQGHGAKIVGRRRERRALGRTLGRAELESAGLRSCALAWSVSNAENDNAKGL